MKIEVNKNYYFAIPIYGFANEFLDLPLQWFFCSIYSPVEIEEGDNLLIKVYDMFTDSSEVKLETIKASELLFGESLMLPYIPLRGKQKWIQLFEEDDMRSIQNLPDLKMSNLEFAKPFEDRRWYRVKNAGFTNEIISQKYSDLKDLEFADELSEVVVKMRVYIHLINQLLSKVKKEIGLEIYKEVLFSILRREPSLTKMSNSDIKDKLINNFFNDYFRADVEKWHIDLKLRI